MPYIKQEDRKRIRKTQSPETAGELNYMITQLCDDYIGGYPNLRYAKVNEIIGVLECAKQEFYRRVIAPYEDQKRLENGDAYCGEHVPEDEFSRVINKGEIV
jgi:hypothetical protein